MILEPQITPPGTRIMWKGSTGWEKYGMVVGEIYTILCWKGDTITVTEPIQHPGGWNYRCFSVVENPTG